MQSVCYPIKWLYNNVLSGYMTGTVAPAYSSTVIYSPGQQVIYNYGVWESVVNNNKGNTPNITPVFNPSATYTLGMYVLYGSAYYVCNVSSTTGSFVAADWGLAASAPWMQVNNSFIGAKERAGYNSQYLTLTWALNRYFQTTFRQPPYPAPYGGGSLFSAIYITNEEPAFTSFLSFTTEALTSNVYTTGTGTDVVLTTYVNDIGSTFIFTINIPSAVYTAINSNPTIANSIINQFITPLIPAGITWTIATY